MGRCEMARNDTSSSHLLHMSRRPDPEVVDHGAVSENVLPCQIFLKRFPPGPDRRLDLRLLPYNHRFPKFPCGRSLFFNRHAQDLILALATEQLLSNFLDAISSRALGRTWPYSESRFTPQSSSGSGRTVRQQAVDRLSDFLNAISLARPGLFSGFTSPRPVVTSYLHLPNPESAPL